MYYVVSLASTEKDPISEDIFLTYHIIGLTGRNASGKGTVASLLTQSSFVYHSLSDTLREELKRRDLEESRDNLIMIGNSLRKDGGPGILADLMLSNITSLGDLYTLVYDWYLSKDLIGVSLKKNPNKPSIKLKNKPGATRTTDAKWVKSEGVFDNKKNFTGKNISKRYPMDVYIYYGNGPNDRFQARNFGGSSTSPVPSWQLELKGKFANQGRIGGGVVYGVMSRMKPKVSPTGKLAYTNKTTWADAKDNKLVDEIYKRLKDNNAKGLNGLSEADIKGLIMEQDQSYRYSKISGLRLIDFLKNNSNKSKVVEALFNYASSESDDSGVYLKMQ